MYLKKYELKKKKQRGMTPARKAHTHTHTCNHLRGREGQKTYRYDQKPTNTNKKEMHTASGVYMENYYNVGEYVCVCMCESAFFVHYVCMCVPLLRLIDFYFSIIFFFNLILRERVLCVAEMNFC